MSLLRSQGSNPLHTLENLPTLFRNPILGGDCTCPDLLGIEALYRLMESRVLGGRPKGAKSFSRVRGCCEPRYPRCRSPGFLRYLDIYGAYIDQATLIPNQLWRLVVICCVMVRDIELVYMIRLFHPGPPFSISMAAFCSSIAARFDAFLGPLSVDRPMAASASFCVYGSACKARSLHS